jgi:hypothetical protein
MSIDEAAAFLRLAGWTFTPPPARSSLHRFAPHRKYPWFCNSCGYGPYEPLKHIQEATGW